MAALARKIFETRFPFNLRELEEVRMDILYEMGGYEGNDEVPPVQGKGFRYYVDQMNEVGDEIKEIMNDPDKVADDEYWSNGSQSEVYWEKQSPWMSKGRFKKALGKLFPGLDAYKKGRSRGSRGWWGKGSRDSRSRGAAAASASRKSRKESIVSRTTSRLLSEKFVDQLVGDASWMTPQQVVLFRTIVGTYFDNDIRLWPINLNMDFVYKTAEEQSASRTWTGNLEKLIKSALAGSGPFILKILQQINTGNESQVEGGLSVAKLTEDIFSNIPGLTLEESQYVKSKFSIAKTYTDNMNPVALGSASIAEAHLSRSGERIHSERIFPYS